jgi:hypothetical protein
VYNFKGKVDVSRRQSVGPQWPAFFSVTAPGTGKTPSITTSEDVRL